MFVINKMAPTFEDLSKNSKDTLKDMCIKAGYKKAGEGWPKCCPPLGQKNDIIRRILEGKKRSSTKPTNAELSCAYYGTLWGIK